ncbi:sensor histidine kinase [Clostridium baratii]|uniref:sensor histidine kinase n=1 Tax=Clostridium baratii TaxID=1561 RepID=UPI0005F2D3FA|nr:sensor histidine kinase [Clostridium baratii]KJU72270.1 histidine kinase [Clostridium baratii]
MRLTDFLKDRIIFIIINILILFFTGALLKALNISNFAILFVIIINMLGIILFHIYDYLRKKKYYSELEKNLDALDKKYLISDVINEGSFLESKILYEIIKKTDKSMNDEIAKFKINNKEYREYIEIWVHEIKTPISTCKLLIENNYNDVTESIDEEINKVENYIEQALFYTRSNDVEKDYIIKEMNLLDCINNVIRKNSDVLISKKVKISIKDLDKKVYCDSKWLEFIVNQIVINSIKYIDKELGEIKFYTIADTESITLNISDNGIGIKEKDINKVFEKGYTGENGRKFSKSTGIGLYLCKKLSNKLGIFINIKSKENEGTTVSIIFPINKMMIFN